MIKANSIRIVLVETSHPGNIGSTARAMKNMGFTRLYLVQPKCFPHQQAIELSAGADDVLQQAVVTRNLSDALQGCHVVYATSARRRKIALENITPALCAEQVMQTNDDTEIAIVFGREYAGLTNEELLLAHYHIHIPCNPEYSSLNLSQAVQIISYELKIKSQMEPLHPKPIKNKNQPASLNEMEQFYEHLRVVLVAIGFLKPSNPKRLFQRLRRLFNRAKLERLEVDILRGILSQVTKSLEVD